jgi:phosphoribosylaminoimidazole-succinocarboxamide synthase
MSAAAAITETRLPYPLVTRGKVRDVYDVGDGLLLFIATDRISAFDVVMPQPIPGKGEVLTQITDWWLRQLTHLVPNHLVTSDADEIVARFPALAESRDVWARRAMLVQRTRPVPIECVVRGYLSGSALKEYRASGTLAGEELPPGLREADRLEPPIFSPATKAETGHDENITFAETKAAIGFGLAERLRELSLAIYAYGRDVAASAGIIIADTKFEFGLDDDGGVILIDEVLTPDSSRFWPVETYAPGAPQPSLDKQPVRDYLEALVQSGQWNKEPPPPNLPDEVISATTDRYREIFLRLTGVRPDAYSAHGAPV